MQEEIGVVTHKLGGEGERRFTRASISNSAKDGLSHFEHGPEQAKYFNISCSAKSSKTFSASSQI